MVVVFCLEKKVVGSKFGSEVEKVEDVTVSTLEVVLEEDEVDVVNTLVSLSPPVV